jgi:predicted ATPase/DNA-binding CsgD family transcriptional regulator
LPQPLTSFVGRVSLRRELLDLAVSHRLVTLTGPGGSGKTRLAVEVARARACEPEFAGAFIDLTAVAPEQDLASSMAGQLQVLAAPGQDLVDAIAETFGHTRQILVLDNCEHVIPGCRDLLRRLLPACPDLLVIATSLVPLHIEGELVRTVPPLSLPPAGVLTAAEAMASESVELFQDRASLSGGFRLDDGNAAAVAEVCRRLDGIPLAIELAAAWVEVLGVTGIDRRLARRLDLLTDSPHAPAARHRSLRAALDWSSELLSPSQSRLWRRLAVFAPLFDLEAVEAVCRDESLPQDQLPALMRSLHERSLIQLQYDQERVARYRLLETVRQYGAEQLAQSGELEEVGGRHARYYVKRAEEAFTHRDQVDLIDWAARMTADHANVRVALDYLHDRDHEAELELSGAMGWIWGARELLPEGRQLLERALQRSASTSWYAARAHRACGLLALEQGDIQTARRRLQTALEMHRAAGDEAGQAICLARLGTLEEASKLVRRSELEEAVNLARRSGEQTALLVALANLGQLELNEGSAAEARRRFNDSVEACRALGHARWLPEMVGGLAQAQLADGDPSAAAGSAREALQLADKAGLQALLPLLIETVAQVEMARGRPRRTLLLAAGAARLRESGQAIPNEWAPRLQAALLGARQALPGAADAIWNEGYRLDRVQTVAVALEIQAEPALPPSAKPFSKRQLQVAKLVAAGLTNTQIGRRLGISERTAEWHVEELRNRLGFVSRAQVAAWAAAQGLTAGESPE